VATLTRVVLQCYYRDDRVVRSLGLEPRPPHPKGHVLEDGDWSLLFLGSTHDLLKISFLGSQAGLRSTTVGAKLIMSGSDSN
jgi:hypothetical protein